MALLRIKDNNGKWIDIPALKGEKGDSYTLTNNDKTEIAQEASKLITVPTPDVSGQIDTHNASTSAHNDIRLLIEGLTTRLNTLANSDDTTLDQMSEIVTYIKNNKTLIEGITTNKVNVSDIINNLTTNVSNKPLSAGQGVALKALIDALDTNKVNKDYVDTQIEAIPAIPKNISAFTNDAGYVTSVPNEVYVGNGAMPQDATIQIITDGTDEEQAIKDDFQNYIDGQLEIAKAEIFKMVIESLGGQPVFGYIDENNNIILNGNIANGTYTLKYENEDGSYAEIGTLTIGEYTPTNIIDTVGYTNDTRLSTSSGETKAETGYVTTGLIDVSNETNPVVITTSGVDFSQSYSALCTYTEDGTSYGKMLISSIPSSNNSIIASLDDNGNLTLTINTSIEPRYARFKLCGCGSGENLIVTVNEPIN
jgi:hypothetical protein